MSVLSAATCFLRLTWHSCRYNTVMKLVYLGTSSAIVYYMRYHRIIKLTYDKEQDTFKSLFLLAPSAVLALLTTQRYTIVEVRGVGTSMTSGLTSVHVTAALGLKQTTRMDRCAQTHMQASSSHSTWSMLQILWTFSIYLEAVAILPQLVLLQRTQNIDNLTGNYVFLLGSYRALYILNWIYRYFTEQHYRQWLVWFCGVVQTVIYCDFFYYYILSWRNNEKLALPA
eukprot:GHUV01032814.1.p1 GENE.GHUV01032814.1~~GHUV01032814.1.p1  ORF type:complete len:227 (+),score=35.82 GHUV01032814.1:90-770(+)